MTDIISEGTNIALYADDTKIWRNIQSWNDHLVLQNDINALYNWSITNKMKFHPKKCKVLAVGVEQSILGHKDWDPFPFKTFHYQLNDAVLDFVNHETDLGVVMTSTLNYHDHCMTLYSKASSRFGLLKRALHFVKDKRKKSAFYLAIVRSLFEHCGVIWRPTSPTAINKLESIQRRAVKWILSEEGHHYNDLEYTNRLKDLDLLPLQYKFECSDLVVFHKIFYNLSVNSIPEYLTLKSEEDKSTLRPVINPPKLMSCSNDKTYCYCKYGESGIMICCGKCDEWFHDECLGLSEDEVDNIKEYYCAECVDRYRLSTKYEVPPVRSADGASCYCRKAESGKMAECGKCKERFHNTCLNLSESELNQTLLFFCRECLLNDSHSSLKIVYKDTSNYMSSMRANQQDAMSLKCSAKASAPAFKSSFFFRTHLLWNYLPTDVKETSTPNEFKTKLEHHMWDIILDPH